MVGASSLIAPIHTGFDGTPRSCGWQGYFPNAGMFEASLELNERIAAELGVKASTAVSTRDVPGWTRAAIPLLAKHGINGMSFGSGTPPGRPYGMPNLFVWRDLGSGKDVVVTSESGCENLGLFPPAETFTCQLPNATHPLDI